MYFRSFPDFSFVLFNLAKPKADDRRHICTLKMILCVTYTVLSGPEIIECFVPQGYETSYVVNIDDTATGLYSAFARGNSMYTPKRGNMPNFHGCQFLRFVAMLKFLCVILGISHNRFFVQYILRDF